MLDSRGLPQFLDRLADRTSEVRREVVYRPGDEGSPFDVLDVTPGAKLQGLATVILVEQKPT